jgi:hypothetical protein
MSIPDYTYENTRRIVYGDDGATFIPVCPCCGRYVKSDTTVLANGEGEVKHQPNATCSKCGRVEMPFEGYV